MGTLGFAFSQLQRLSVNTSLSEWYSNAAGLQVAKNLQNNNGKPIALFFHTETCASCKQLKANVLGQDSIAQYLQNFIVVKIDPETSASERDLANRFGVLGYPSFFILKSNSTTAIRIPVSARTQPQQFVTLLENATRPS